MFGVTILSIAILRRRENAFSLLNTEVTFLIKITCSCMRRSADTEVMLSSVTASCTSRSDNF